MQVKRLTLAAGVETAFEFDNFDGNSVLVKNETADEILFCDKVFNAEKAAHIPAFSWQSLKVQVLHGEKPKFYVKSVAGGNVEIDLGSDGMGQMGNVLDVAGMIPHKLTLTQGEDTTLTVILTRLHGQTLDLDTTVSLTTGATVFNGDVISITPAADNATDYVKLKINGVNFGRLEAAISLVINGETTIETEAVTLVVKTLTLTVGENTTLTAAQTRLAGMLTDLTTPSTVVSGGAIDVGDIVEFTVASTQGDGYHATLTIGEDAVDLDDDGKSSVTVEDDITAVSASVADKV